MLPTVILSESSAIIKETSEKNIHYRHLLASAAEMALPLLQIPETLDKWGPTSAAPIAPAPHYLCLWISHVIR